MFHLLGLSAELFAKPIQSHPNVVLGQSGHFRDFAIAEPFELKQHQRAIDFFQFPNLALQPFDLILLGVVGMALGFDPLFRMKGGVTSARLLSLRLFLAIVHLPINGTGAEKTYTGLAKE